jgi:hypothetical protein
MLDRSVGAGEFWPAAVAETGGGGGVVVVVVVVVSESPPPITVTISAIGPLLAASVPTVS